MAKGLQYVADNLLSPVALFSAMGARKPNATNVEPTQKTRGQLNHTKGPRAISQGARSFETIHDY